MGKLEFTENLIEAVNLLKQEMDSHPYTRYLSWEHCYKEFNNAFSSIENLKEDDYLKLSLHLAFYLASWGMYRGSSFLLQFDYKIHLEAVKLILCEKYKPLLGYYWNKENINFSSNMDLIFGDKTNKGLFNLLSENYNSKRKIIKEAEKGISDILITKILLGTLGCVPAYDKMLKQTLQIGKCEYKITGFIQTFSRKSFENLIEFYSSEKEQLDENRRKFTFQDSASAEYPQMKFLDMCLWQFAQIKSQEEKNIS